MPVLVYSSERRKNQKRPLSWTNGQWSTYVSASKLIDAIIRNAKDKIVVKRDRHEYVAHGKRPLTIRVKHRR